MRSSRTFRASKKERDGPMVAPDRLGRKSIPRLVSANRTRRSRAGVSRRARGRRQLKVIATQQVFAVAETIFVKNVTKNYLN